MQARLQLRSRLSFFSELYRETKIYRSKYNFVDFTDLKIFTSAKIINTIISTVVDPNRKPCNSKFT